MKKYSVNSTELIGALVSTTAVYIYIFCICVHKVPVDPTTWRTLGSEWLQKYKILKCFVDLFGLDSNGGNHEYCTKIYVEKAVPIKNRYTEINVPFR